VGTRRSIVHAVSRLKDIDKQVRKALEMIRDPQIVRRRKE